jgi:hypothetical protein
MRLQVVLDRIVVEERVVDVEQKDEVVHGSPERKRDAPR